MTIPKEISEVLTSPVKAEIETLLKFYQKATNRLDVNDTGIRGFMHEKLKYGKPKGYSLGIKFTEFSPAHQTLIVYESNDYKIFLDYRHNQIHFDEDSLKHYYYNEGYPTCMPQHSYSLEYYISDVYRTRMEVIWRTVKIDCILDE